MQEDHDCRPGSTDPPTTEQAAVAYDAAPELLE